MRSEVVRTVTAVVLCVAVAAATQAAERIIYVDGAATGTNNGSSWSDAYVALQDAMTTAVEADEPIEIRVAQGVYKPDQGAGFTPGDREVSFSLLDGVTLKGGYVGIVGPDPDLRDAAIYTTILSGDLNNDDDADDSNLQDNSYTVVTGSLDEGTALVEGFTITAGHSAGMLIHGGQPVIRHCRFTVNDDTGLWLQSTSDAIVAECTFRENRTGMRDFADGTDLANCRFVENDHAGLHTWGADCVLTGCLFDRNQYEGIRGTTGDLTLEDCVFVENGGQGIQGPALGTISLLRCSFVANGGAIEHSGSVTAQTCTFAENAGLWGTVSCNNHSTFVDCRFVGNTATQSGPGALEAWGATVTITDCLFAGNSARPSGGSHSGAIKNSASVMKLSNCLFTGNAGGESGPGAIFHDGQVLRISNCTFADNRGEFNTLMYGRFFDTTLEMTQSIVWDGPESFTPKSSSASNAVSHDVNVSHSNVQGGYTGEGNIDIDPCFVAPGYWDPNGTEDNLEDDVWVMGDYHLKSQAGHWDETTKDWVLDEVTSPCIDLGDPNGPLGSEPFPNGGFVNLGAYGGTNQASHSYFGAPVCETQIAGDINGDCRVDDVDLDILMSHWLMSDADTANSPPIITIISPEDGAELTEPTPIILHAEAADSDGTVVHVSYSMEYRQGTNHFWTQGTVREPDDGWAHQSDWSNISFDGVYEVWAEAVDDNGGRTVSPTITITLHPSD